MQEAFRAVSLDKLTKESKSKKTSGDGAWKLQSGRPEAKEEDLRSREGSVQKGRASTHVEYETPWKMRELPTRLGKTEVTVIPANCFRGVFGDRNLNRVGSRNWEVKR